MIVIKYNVTVRDFSNEHNKFNKYNNKTIDELIKNTKRNNIDWLPIRLFKLRRRNKNFNPYLYSFISDILVEYNALNAYNSFYTLFSWGAVCLINTRISAEEVDYCVYIQKCNRYGDFSSAIESIDSNEQQTSELVSSVLHYFTFNRTSHKIRKALFKIKEYTRIMYDTTFIEKIKSWFAIGRILIYEMYLEFLIMLADLIYGSRFYKSHCHKKGDSIYSI